jgi:hypothetical protein
MARPSNNLVHTQDLDAENHLGRQGTFTLCSKTASRLTTTLQLFLRFEGPTTMLLQSRASRISDVLTLKDVSEIAETPPGTVQDVVANKIKQEIKEIAAGNDAKAALAAEASSGTIKYVTMKDGKAEFEKTPSKPSV